MNLLLRYGMMAAAIGLIANGALVAQYINSVSVDKTQDFLQVSSAAPTSQTTLGSPGGNFNFAADVMGGGLSSYSAFKVALPNATQKNLNDMDPGYDDYYGIAANYSSKAAMDAAYPDGTYTISTGSSTLTASLGTVDQYPSDIPMVTNGTWDAMGNLVIDPAVGATLNFNTFNGYVPNPSYSTYAGGQIDFSIYGVTGNQLTSYVGGNDTISLGSFYSDPALTSYTIPPGMLKAGQTYYAELAFFRIVSLNEGSQAFLNALSIPYFGYYTGFMITTGPAPIAPTVSVLPLSQSVAKGSPVMFTGTVGGTPTPTLQWQKNSVNISGATSATLSIASAATTDAGTYTLVASNSAGTTTSNAATLVITAPIAGTVNGDFNGDGHPDILWSNTTTGDRAIWFMNGTNIGQFTYLAYVPPVWHIVGTADFNGDGQSDIIWENTATGDRSVWLMSGTTIVDFPYLAWVDPVWHIAAAGDFSGNGQTDLIWENTAGVDRAVWFLNGTNISSFGYLAGIPNEWKIVGAADFNGDGKTDLVWENTLTGDRSIWLMNGTTILSFVDLGNVATAWHIAMLADFNGDGQTDILWENTTTGDRAIWLMNGTTHASSVYLAYVDPVWRIAP